MTVEGHVEDMGDGSYAVTYTPFIAGTYLLLVEKNGQALYLPGERQLIEVLPGEIDGRGDDPMPFLCALPSFQRLIMDNVPRPSPQALLASY